MNQKCRLRLLTQEQIKSIHQRSLDILEKVGVNVHSPAAIEILADAGCRVEGQRVHFPALLVEKLCQIKQKSVVLHSRTGRHLESGTGEIYAHNTGIVSTIADAKTGKQREATLQDAVALVKLMDALDNIHAITPIIYPQDVEPQLALLYAVRELFKNTSKPFHGPGVRSLAEAQYIYRMVLAVAGDEKTLREKPMFSLACSPLSPLTLPKEDVETAIWGAKKGIPIQALPCPTAGMTAPITMLGALTQQNAEVLAVLMLVRLIDPSVPVSYAARLAYPDMRYGNVLGGGPEGAIVSACAVQLANHYNLESNVYGPDTSAFVADAQTGMDKMASTLLPAMAGSDWLSGAGSLGGAVTVSYEQLVIDNEIFSVVFHLLGDLQDDQEELGFSAIQDVMNQQSQFLRHPNTLKYLRSQELWGSTQGPQSVGNSRGYSGWLEDGSKSMADTAREKVDKILKEHEVEPLDAYVERGLDDIIQVARRELVSAQ